MAIMRTARAALAVLLSISLFSSTCIAQPLAQNATRQFPEDQAGFPQYPTSQPAAPRGGQFGTGFAGTTSLNFPPDRGDSSALQCDRWADSPLDPQRVGDGVALDKIEIDQALPVCRQAAERQPARPRYQYLYGRVLDAAKRYPEAVTQYSAADRGGYGAASYAMADFYENGIGVPKDLNQALRFYSRAGNAGIADAFDAGGAIYAQGKPPNYREAKLWFERAVQGGSPDGYADLGLIYGSGYGVPKNPAMAINLFREAANRGSYDGMYFLGLAYRDGAGTTKDPVTGCQWVIKAAGFGHPYAEQEAGRCYYNGTGVAPDHLAAFNWFAKAGQAGVVNAKVITADMLDTGDGWKQDKEYAVMWYRAAAELGDAYAMTQLGAHLRLGQGTDQNETEAMQWFLKAAQNGYAPAETSLALGYESGLAQGRPDYQQAALWFGKAVEQDDGYAALNLGALYEKGLGVPQNLQRAKQLYARAAGNSNPDIAKLGKQYFADVPNTASPGSTPDRSAVGTSKSSSDFWSVLIVGALAIGAVALLTSGGSSSTSGSATPYTPYTPFSSSPSTSPSQSVPAPRPPHPCVGNIGKTLDGAAGLGFDNVCR